MIWILNDGLIWFFFFVCFLSKVVINYKIYFKNNWFLNNELFLVDLIFFIIYNVKIYLKIWNVI